jgi:hypothetical protein
MASVASQDFRESESIHVRCFLYFSGLAKLLEAVMGFRKADRTARTPTLVVGRILLALSLIVTVGCSHPYCQVSAPFASRSVIASSSAKEDCPAGSESSLPTEKPTMVQRADRCASRIRDDAVVVHRAVSDKCELVANSDLILVTVTVIAVPFFFLAHGNGCSYPLSIERLSAPPI